MIHYAGEIVTATSTTLAGWAACCSGRKAERIRADGSHTYRASEVTCGRCLSILTRTICYFPGDDSACGQRERCRTQAIQATRDPKKATCRECLASIRTAEGALR